MQEIKLFFFFFFGKETRKKPFTKQCCKFAGYPTIVYQQGRKNFPSLTGEL